MDVRTPYKAAVVVSPEYKFQCKDTRNSIAETEFGLRLLLKETGHLCDWETVRLIGQNSVRFKRPT
jgi:hypothetical protein